MCIVNDMDPPSAEARAIPLTLLNGTGYVFDVDDYMTLRRRHRIVGVLVGTSCARGWAAGEKTLPMELTKEEARLLVEEGIAVLVSKREALLRPPTASQLAQYRSTAEARLAEQAEALRQEKLREAKRNLAKVLAGKRRKLLAAGVAEDDTRMDEAQILKGIADSVVFDRKNALMDIPCAHLGRHGGRIVRMPPDTSLKYRVFRHFWEQGNYVTPGDAFGGDFLIYPGDPMLYHASHIVVLLDRPLVPATELVAKVRLSVIVNKGCVFAYLASTTDANAPHPEVHFQTVEWDNANDQEPSTP